MIIAKLHKEYSLSGCILQTKLDYACDVISMFKIDNTIAFRGISVNGTHVSRDVDKNRVAGKFTRLFW